MGLNPPKWVEARQSSIASLPSSSNGTTPGSSPISSQCSSDEQLHAGMPSMVNEEFPSRFMSNESIPSLDEEGIIRSTGMRLRSCSIGSSPDHSLTASCEDEIVQMNTLYQERFPKATQQMEERLANFIETHRDAGFSDAIKGFAHNQVLEMARDCLAKSQEKLITSNYFHELSENLDKLLTVTREKSPQALAHLSSVIRELLLIVSRPARLLECLEFDPEKFYRRMEETEDQVRGTARIKEGIPRLLITALGHIKLTDFGLSKIGIMSHATNIYEGFVDRETRQFSDKQVFGTPEYIAPEVILSLGYGKPVDWWSMGVILYEFLIGCVPFLGETPEELFAHTVSANIEWPDESDWPVDPQAKNLITGLLQQSPLDRLGTVGAAEVKEHPFFESIDWDSLLRQKAEFIPQLEHEEDTSYFDTRLDRYNHESDADDDDAEGSSLFSSFSSCSPHFMRDKMRDSDNSGSESTPGTPEQEHPRFSSNGSSGNGFPFPAPVTPDPSQAEQAASPLVIRKRRINIMPCFPSPDDSPDTLPPTAFSENGDSTGELSPVKERSYSRGNADSPLIPEASTPTPTSTSAPSTPTKPAPSEKVRKRSEKAVAGKRSSSIVVPPGVRRISKGASASGLSFRIPLDESLLGIQTPSESSTASSREASPNRDSGSLSSFKPPVILRRSRQGFGFTIKTIPVYYGDTDYYTLHHIAVNEGSLAHEAGLRTGDLITHINGESVQGRLHTEVLQMLLSGKDPVSIHATPLENTSIKAGGRRRSAAKAKLTRRTHRVHHGGKGRAGAKSSRNKKKSLSKRVSIKRAVAEAQKALTSQRRVPILHRSLSTCEPPFHNEELSQISSRFGSTSSQPSSPRPIPSNSMHGPPSFHGRIHSLDDVHCSTGSL
ncbi:unnamed protein product [Darwinula stevensoni]|uniref:non-specific serine/threonine protein kinase n=1 Tax=Darwinula stevensoni TaxID=69355 RepID=A0A7R9A6I6_9CRUS|nr:unnamed protein product [Darwinula stevensoni]CAG0894680.1 unnamed protein product [Darwinula stevensoni]